MSDENVGGLVARWRAEADINAPRLLHPEACEAKRECADELEAALSAHGQPVVDEDALLAVAVKAWDEHQMNCRITTVSGSLRQVVKAIRADLTGATP